MTTHGGNPQRRQFGILRVAVLTAFVGLLVYVCSFFFLARCVVADTSVAFQRPDGQYEVVESSAPPVSVFLSKDPSWNRAGLRFYWPIWKPFQAAGVIEAVEDINWLRIKPGSILEYREARWIFVCFFLPLFTAVLFQAKPFLMRMRGSNRPIVGSLSSSLPKM